MNTGGHDNNTKQTTERWEAEIIIKRDPNHAACELLDCTCNRKLMKLDSAPLPLTEGARSSRVISRRNQDNDRPLKIHVIN